jgi:hypothetical protein
MRPGISFSAISISLRPNAASETSSREKTRQVSGLHGRMIETRHTCNLVDHFEREELVREVEMEEENKRPGDAIPKLYIA